MNSRERMLGIAVLSLVVLIGGYYAFDAISTGLDQRQNQIDQLRQQRDDRQRKLRQAKKAGERLRTYAAKSLPADGDVARSLYQNLLLDKLEAAGFRNVKVTLPGSRGMRDAYQLHTFDLTCEGNLSQLVDILYQFHSVDRLNRIRRLIVSPIKETKDLKVSATVEALSMRQADLTDRLSETKSSRLALSSIDEYRDVIVGRNLFSTANRPPRIASLGTQRISIGRSLDISVKADDPDKLDKVAYGLADGAPTGVRLDPKTGRLSWTPREKGEFKFQVLAFDDGLPSKKDQQTVTVSVTDPPPPPVAEAPTKRKLDFDDAKFTFVTAILEDQGEYEAWLTIRTNGRVLKLHVGDAVNIGSVEGKIRRIEAGFVEIATDEKQFAVALGDNLMQTQPIAAPDKEAGSQ